MPPLSSLFALFFFCRVLTFSFFLHLFLFIIFLYFSSFQISYCTCPFCYSILPFSFLFLFFLLLWLISMLHYYYLSYLQPLKTTFLAIFLPKCSHPIFFPLCYNILILSLPLLIFVCWLLMWWLLLHFFNFTLRCSLFLYFNLKF